ncbi:MAG: META domain-containing protein [Rikenellaceae bacterium]
MKHLFFISLALLAFVISCGTVKVSSQSGEFNLEATSWQVEQLNGNIIEPVEANFTLLFSEDGTLNARGACNIIFGDYIQKSGGVLSLSPKGMTRTACPDMDVEAQYIKALESVVSFDVVDGVLHLMDSQGDTVVTLKSK